MATRVDVIIYTLKPGYIRKVCAIHNVNNKVINSNLSVKLKESSNHSESMSSKGSHQPPSNKTNKKKQLTYGELYGRATTDPPPPKKERDKKKDNQDKEDI